MEQVDRCLLVPLFSSYLSSLSLLAVRIQATFVCRHDGDDDCSRELFPRQQSHHWNVWNFFFKLKMLTRRFLKPKNTKDSPTVSFDASKKKEPSRSGVATGPMSCVTFPRSVLLSDSRKSLNRLRCLASLEFCLQRTVPTYVRQLRFRSQSIQILHG